MWYFIIVKEIGEEILSVKGFPLMATAFRSLPRQSDSLQLTSFPAGEAGVFCPVALIGRWNDLLEGTCE